MVQVVLVSSPQDKYVPYGSACAALVPDAFTSHAVGPLYLEMWHAFSAQLDACRDVRGLNGRVVWCCVCVCVCA